MSLTLKRFVNHFLLDSFYRTMTRVKHSSMKKKNSMRLVWPIDFTQLKMFLFSCIALL